MNFQEELEMLTRIRVILSGLTIEAKSASDVVMIDAAIDSVINSLTKKANNAKSKPSEIMPNTTK